jgi:RNA polymerase sigma-70 factor, TIGR02957 family
MIDTFSGHRAHLFGIAYRMLGSVAEAEDMVQETWLRWQKQGGEAREPRAWLTTTITRLCIDQLRLARRQREEYFGVWLPEPLVSESGTSPSADAALADSLGVAFLLLLEELAPVDRAVFLLREVFEHEYMEIAEIVGRSEAACRQIVSRAKARLARREVREGGDSGESEQMVRQFLEACETGNLDALLAMLTEDAVLYTDGGGVVRSAPKPIHPPDHIARFLIGVRRRMAKWHPDTPDRDRLVRVNGDPGVLTRRRDGVLAVTAFAFEGGRIRALYIVSNPHKLRALDPELLESLGAE